MLTSFDKLTKAFCYGIVISLLRRRSLASSRNPGGTRDEPKERLRGTLYYYSLYYAWHNLPVL